MPKTTLKARWIDLNTPVVWEALIYQWPDTPMTTQELPWIWWTDIWIVAWTTYSVAQKDIVTVGSPVVNNTSWWTVWVWSASYIINKAGTYRFKVQASITVTGSQNDAWILRQVLGDDNIYFKKNWANTWALFNIWKSIAAPWWGTETQTFSITRDISCAATDTISFDTNLYNNFWISQVDYLNISATRDTALVNPLV